MQLNIQPQNFVPQQTTGAPQMSQMTPGSQYSGTPHVNTGQPMQMNTQALSIGVPPAQPQPGQHYQHGVLTTHTVHPTGAEQEVAEIIPTPAMPADGTARVSISMGFTKNIGDYQSFKANVSVDLPWPVATLQQGLDECQRIATERCMQMWHRG